MGSRLTHVQALAAAQGVVGLIDAKRLRSVLYVSRNGTSWERQQACPTGSQPQTLSTATDPSKGIGSLWVTCTTATTTSGRLHGHRLLGQLAERGWHVRRSRPGARGAHP